jgi:hypothetical protein
MQQDPLAYFYRCFQQCKIRLSLTWGVLYTRTGCRCTRFLVHFGAMKMYLSFVLLDVLFIIYIILKSFLLF